MPKKKKFQSFTTYESCSSCCKYSGLIDHVVSEDSAGAYIHTSILYVHTYIYSQTKEIFFINSVTAHSANLNMYIKTTCFLIQYVKIRQKILLNEIVYEGFSIYKTNNMCKQHVSKKCNHGFYMQINRPFYTNIVFDI